MSAIAIWMMVSTCCGTYVSSAASLAGQRRDRNALAAVPLLRRGERLHQRMVSEVLAHDLAQHSGSLPMHDPYEGKAREVGVVQVFVQLGRNLLGTPAADVGLDLCERRRRPADVVRALLLVV